MGKNKKNNVKKGERNKKRIRAIVGRRSGKKGRGRRRGRRSCNCNAPRTNKGTTGEPDKPSNKQAVTGCLALLLVILVFLFLFTQDTFYSHTFGISIYMLDKTAQLAVRNAKL